MPSPKLRGVINDMRLSRTTRAIAALAGTAFVGGIVIAVLDGDWWSAAAMAGFAVALFAAAWSGRDPENPDGLHQSFRLTAMREEVADHRARAAEADRLAR